MPAERVRSEMRGATHASPAARCRGDVGAILVEAAFLTPLYLVLMFGIIEFGGAFRDYLTVNNAASSGARQASISANSVDADYQIIQAVKRASSAMPPAEILHIVVFHATSPDSTLTSVSASCAAFTASSGVCNTYTSAAFGWTSSSTHWGCGALSNDQYWCPTTRKAAQTGANGPPDFIGVYIQATHPYITGLFGSSLTLTKTSILKIEPQSLT